MINPNKTHLIKNCEILKKDSYIEWITVKTPDGQIFKGKQKYGAQPFDSFQCGDRVNIRVNYSIVGEEYVFWQLTKTKTNPKKPKPPKLKLIIGGKTESVGVRQLRANIKASRLREKRIADENSQANKRIKRRLR